MIILIAGASHTGKTVLAQKMLEKYKIPYFSIDHLKMGLIRSGNTNLTPEDDVELGEYLWPIIREMIKTAIENSQNLVMSETYINSNFNQIKEYANAVENRLDDSWCTKEFVLEENAHHFEMCKKYGCNYILIDEAYCVDIELQNYSLNVTV